VKFLVVTTFWPAGRRGLRIRVWRKGNKSMIPSERVEVEGLAGHAHERTETNLGDRIEDTRENVIPFL
jgi:hypothetical protein